MWLFGVQESAPGRSDARIYDQDTTEMRAAKSKIVPKVPAPNC
ncbi:hypothetical protein T09_11736 [Trichinella sp. T9]|nr:hypothetical protein T09_11736 [Trichinella sp. T9]